MTSAMMSTGAVQVRGGIRQHVKHMAELTETLAGAWGSVDRQMVTFLAMLSKSFYKLHADMICVLVSGQKQQIRQRQWSWQWRLSFWRRRFNLETSNDSKAVRRGTEEAYWPEKLR